MTALLTAGAELAAEIFTVVKLAIESKREDAVALATAAMVDAIAALRTARAAAVADVADAFAEAQAEINRKEGT
jgi:hypothetical protein